MDFSVSTMDKFQIIKLAGKIDWENARNLDQKINSLIEEGYTHLVFNLDEVTFICSGGIGALVYNLNKIKKMKGAIYLISSNDYINFITETLKFDIIFDGYLFDTFESFCKEVVEKVEQTN